MSKPEIFDFTTKQNIKLAINLYRAKNDRKNITILYFHGGGLLYGVRDDLPQIYIDKFLNSGYDLLTFDYPLAPESKLDIILNSTFELLDFYLNNRDEVFDLKNNQYVLFGRSAGAYLAFMMCDRLIKANVLRPCALISLYGYARLDEAAFATPSKYYNKLAAVSDESIEKIISDTPVVYGPMNVRFSLYIKARQDGTWIKSLCGEENPAAYSLTEEILQEFPPTILAAATLDPDVPYRMTKTLSRQIPQAQLITVYQEAHDFDRDISDPSGKTTYDAILEWLHNQIG
ncbi:MAG: alpha/beta hydrolase [Sporomusaceae bacterium]|nr:alpha/beta hydrolase [Sporomusaceae bacterium]